MDGKLLILCDENPDSTKDIKIRDKNFLASNYIDPDDNPDQIFMSWDALIPEDRTFVDECIAYGKFKGVPKPDFAMTKKGKVDPKYGNIMGSIQEDSYLEMYDINLERIKIIKNNGGDVEAEQLELACQFVFDANLQLFTNFSNLLNKNGIIRIIPAYSKTTDPDLIRYRQSFIEAWELQNRFLHEKQSSARLLLPFVYENMDELYSKASNEMLNIISLPMDSFEPGPRL